MARQRFADYLEEFRQTQQAVNACTEASREHHGDYAYVAGYYGSMVADLIAQLPRAKRQEYRETLERRAQEFRNKTLMQTIKDTQ